jgi:uncharacterized protein (DUF1501 family)
MLSRREFLSRSALISLAPTVPAFLARAARATVPDREGRVLVVVQLDGGNDGINTVVPFADENYARHRKQLRLPTDRLIKLNDRVALNSALTDAAKLLDSRRLAIVQGVGYPNPSRSHARSMAVWQTASFDPEEHAGLGWIGRGLDEDRRRAAAASSLFVGAEAVPAALRGRRSIAGALARLEDFDLGSEAAAARAMASEASADGLASFVHRSMLDAYTIADRLKDTARLSSSAAYPETGLAGRLRFISGLLKAGYAARVYYTVQSGYDTHAAQVGTHASLLREFAGALKAFLDDLAGARLADRVAVLAFSEFGRQLQENASAGTDHGVAGPVFLAGNRVHAGVAGTAPSLTDLDAGAPKMTVDFRRVYAAILDDWLGIPAKVCLGGEFAPLPLFRNS